MGRTLSATGSTATLLGPTRCLPGRLDGSAPSMLPPRGTWTTGPHNRPLILTPSPSIRSTNPITHHTRTHVYCPTPSWRPSSARSWYLPTSSDIVDQAPPAQMGLGGVGALAVWASTAWSLCEGRLGAGSGTSITNMYCAQITSNYLARCKAMRPGHSVRFKICPKDFWTD